MKTLVKVIDRNGYEVIFNKDDVVTVRSAASYNPTDYSQNQKLVAITYNYCNTANTVFVVGEEKEWQTKLGFDEIIALN